MRINFSEVFTNRYFLALLLILIIMLLMRPLRSDNDLTKLLSGDGEIGDNLGTAVAVSGDLLVAGAPYSDDYGDFSGSAYLFRRSGGGWSQEAKLLASYVAGYTFFGQSLAVNDQLVCVGSPGEGTGGAVYMFHQSGANWVEQQKLTAGSPSSLARFGQSVSLQDQRLIIGANGYNFWRGAAYIFHWNGTQWVEAAMLTAPNAEMSDDFGISVSISGERVLIGADGDDDMGPEAGAAYIFRWNGSNWVQEAKLTASDGDGEDSFGNSVSLSGDWALVGAVNDDGSSHDAGAAYCFHWNGSAWQEVAKLTADDGQENDGFGCEVALSGNAAIVGAFFHDLAEEDAGTAYVFQWDGNAWSQISKLIAEDADFDDEFGYGVALSGATAVIGAPSDNQNAVDAGAVYVVELDLSSGIADEGKPLPAQFALYQNYPNPFNPTTVIRYQLSVVSDVKLAVYNLLGTKITSLVNARQGAGVYRVQWDGRDDEGMEVSSGIYLYRLETGIFSQARKMILVR
ncbi:MAG: T9SS type A sorting domain-containing protein [Calditrichae bacterium]|nr:T9SS type A sorting domain-containing protein [Calditrichia bacterium]